LIVDEVMLVCSVIASVISGEPDMEVSGCATTLDEAMDLVDECDIALVSTTMTDNRALELTRAIVMMNPEIKVLVMGLVEAGNVIVQHIEAGASGYLLRDDSVDELLKNIRAAYRNEALVSPEVAAALMARIAELAGSCQEAWVDGQQYTDLTPREREVLDLVRQGLSNQEIADYLTIELGTVKNHVHNILRKLNVRSRHDAVAFSGFLEDNNRLAPSAP
jgi:DNA-binding NarL/FixJ family response regulator